ncbi:hypothetical protein TUM3794_06400 [Shewanella colwelliana]|uniref:Uncharacterized protein n=1 Tax=Shewanella colwelliana TaxID=23 RepID=A0ABQ4NVH5_SHECO|nr:hypothetical protein TUM3794_06400 [Shewanella colwelliana]
MFHSLPLLLFLSVNVDRIDSRVIALSQRLFRLLFLVVISSDDAKASLFSDELTCR